MSTTSDRELSDLELGNRPPADRSSLEGPEPPLGDKRWILWAIVAVLVLILVSLGIWYFFFRTSAEPRDALPAIAEQPATTPAPTDTKDAVEEEIELPPLSASDTLVRGMVGELSSHPRLLAWLANDELIHKLVATVDNIAEGTSPRPHLRTAGPRSPFPAIEENGRVVIDPEGYRRYDSVVAAFTGLNPEGAVKTFERLQPLVEEAYRQLGYPDADFEETLQRAVIELLEVPVVEGEVRLIPQVSSYEYADPRLERLTDAQKHLLRAGPDNVRRVQAQLRALARELGMPPEQLPETRVIRTATGP